MQYAVGRPGNKASKPFLLSCSFILALFDSQAASVLPSVYVHNNTWERKSFPGPPLFAICLRSYVIVNSNRHKTGEAQERS